MPRIVTISNDLFTLFISHDKMTKEAFKDRVKYSGYQMYSKFVTSVVGHSSQTHRDIRVIDVADILFVQSGFVGSQKLEGCKMKFDARKVVTIFHNDRNIDFVMEDEEERASLLNAIHLIRKCYEESKVRLGRERKLLRYIWYDTGQFVFLLLCLLVCHQSLVSTHQRFNATTLKRLG